jgi:uncharacterized protein YndB with AHSA1/START domain
VTEAESPIVAVVRRLLPAPPEIVFDEWIDPAALAEWMCPRPARCLAVEIEPVVGGVVHLDIEELNARFSVTGRFVLLDRPHRLSFTWSCSTWPDPSRSSVVDVRLEPRSDGRTMMTIEHSLLPADIVDEHRHGWNVIAEQLEAALSATGDEKPVAASQDVTEGHTRRRLERT